MVEQSLNLTVAHVQQQQQARVEANQPPTLLPPFGASQGTAGSPSSLAPAHEPGTASSSASSSSSAAAVVVMSPSSSALAGVAEGGVKKGFRGHVKGAARPVQKARPAGSNLNGHIQHQKQQHIQYHHHQQQPPVNQKPRLSGGEEASVEPVQRLNARNAHQSRGQQPQGFQQRRYENFDVSGSSRVNGRRPQGKPGQASPAKEEGVVEEPNNKAAEPVMPVEEPKELGFEDAEYEDEMFPGLKGSRRGVPEFVMNLVFGGVSELGFSDDRTSSSSSSSSESSASVPSSIASSPSLPTLENANRVPEFQVSQEEQEQEQEQESGEGKEEEEEQVDDFGMAENVGNLGISPLTSNPEIPAFAQLIRLNVGGRVFECGTSTLLQIPESLFTGIFTGKIPQNMLGEYFFDRDPNVFEVLLNFCRTKKLYRPGHMSLESIREEARYFGIEHLMFPLSGDRNQSSSGAAKEVRFQKILKKTLTPGKKIRFSVLQHQELILQSVSGQGQLLVDISNEDGEVEVEGAVVYDCALDRVLKGKQVEGRRDSEALGFKKQSFGGGRSYDFSGRGSGKDVGKGEFGLTVEFALVSKYSPATDQVF